MTDIRWEMATVIADHIITLMAIVGVVWLLLGGGS